MKAFEFTVNIEAEDKEEARNILLSMFDIMKTARKETSTKDFIQFATKIRENPSLVKRAKLFI